MGYMSRKPTSNEPQKKSDNPWSGETECMDITALAISGRIKRCGKCNRITNIKYLTEEMCPDCV